MGCQNRIKLVAMEKVIVFFDFDGTISSKNSLFHFVCFAVGKPTFYIGLVVLSPLLIAFVLKLVNNEVAKEMFITYFFKDWEYTKFREITKMYTDKHIDIIIKTKAKEKISWHKDNGHKIVVVSASIDCWLRGWCEKTNVDLIATKLEVLNNKLTGKFLTKNCYGVEKVNRIKEQYNLADYERIYAYGNSKGDAEMLKIAHVKNCWV